MHAASADTAARWPRCRSRFPTTQPIITPKVFSTCDRSKSWQDCRSAASISMRERAFSGPIFAIGPGILVFLFAHRFLPHCQLYEFLDLGPATSQPAATPLHRLTHAQRSSSENIPFLTRRGWRQSSRASMPHPLAQHGAQRPNHFD